jgi:hypothetical protein
MSAKAFTALPLHRQTIKEVSEHFGGTQVQKNSLANRSFATHRRQYY